MQQNVDTQQNVAIMLFVKATKRCVRVGMNENELYILRLIGLLIAYKVYSFMDDLRLEAIEIIFEGSEEDE